MSGLRMDLLTSFIDTDLIDPSQIHHEHRKRTIRSKYDTISVHVLIDKYEYVFSRFNLSRYLMACQVPPQLAADVPRRIKKELVDSGTFEITQEELTRRVFELISQTESSALFQRRFKLIQAFNLERVPLIIILSGTGYLGKPTLAFQLGERLNISTILQTSIVNALTNGTNDHLNQRFWYREYESREEFIAQYHADSEVAQRGIAGDLAKTLTDGKPLIVEGIHLDPGRVLAMCGGNSLVPLDSFKLGAMGKIARGKMGFILPILLTRPPQEIQAAVRQKTFTSSVKREERPNLVRLARNVVALQEYLEAKFPAEYVVPISPMRDAVDRIHEIFLHKLEAYYAARASTTSEAEAM